MAVKKTNDVKAKKTEQSEQKFSKKQILASAKYAGRRDLLNALLHEEKAYTLETVENLIQNYMKGQVK